MIEAVGIYKNFGKKAEVNALTDISFKVEQGELFGLIGPDGAGKTTLFRILTTLMLPDKGMAKVIGHDIVSNYKEIRKRIGYMPGRFSLYQDLTVVENLMFYANIFNTTIETNYHLIKDIYVQLEPFKDRRAGALSGGMKQKLALCCALIHKPEVLFLDEPTTGVDAVSRKEFWEMLKRLKHEGITIMVSTPYMDEASLCERIALIQNGTILSQDTPDALVSEFKDALLGVKASSINEARKALISMENVKNVYAFGEYLHLTYTKNMISKEMVRSYLLDKNFKDIEVINVQPTIEDCFIALI
ncbi:MAG: ABC transporter ATP-binding protein [Saprospiraceae bacterium]